MPNTESSNLTPVQFWVLMALAGLALVAAVVNPVLIQANREQQAEVASRAQYLQQTAALEPIYRDLLGGIVELGGRNNDADLRKLAGNHGVTFKASEIPAGTPIQKK